MKFMKISSAFIMIGITILSLCTGCNQKTTQEDNIQKAQNILNYIVEGDIENLETQVNQNILDQMPPVLFIQTFRQMEEQFGPIYSLSNWEEFTSSGSTLYFKDIAFGEHDFRLTIAFDPDGKANTIYLNPLTEEGFMIIEEE